MFRETESLFCQNAGRVQPAECYNRNMKRLRAVTTFSILLIATTAAAAGRVELDVRLEPGVPAADLQRWSAMLGEAGFDAVRLGGGSATTGPTVESIPGASGTSYKVSALLTKGNQLLVPGGRYGVGDKAAVAAWVAKLRSEGPPLRPGEKRPPFGLSVEMLDAVKRDLGRTADFSTKDRTPVEVVNDLANRLTHQVSADAAVAAELGRGEKVPGELKGLACGTVAAAVLRREGLSLVPKPTAGGGAEYTIVRAAKNQDVWPVGWEPERPLMEILPEYFTLRNVKIDAIPASQLLQVIAERLKLPMLFDEQALVLKKLDPSKAMVNLPEGQLAYGTVLDRAMYQASLKHEVRLDDAGRPFLWITSR